MTWFDTFDPAPGNASEAGHDDVACWMVDTDHDGENFFARRIHFPGADDDKQIKKLIDAIGKNADDVEREALTAMRSAPFDPPEQGRMQTGSPTTGWPTPHGGRWHLSTVRRILVSDRLDAEASDARDRVESEVLLAMEPFEAPV